MTDEAINEGEMDAVEMPDVTKDETLRDVIAALSALPAVKESDIQAIVARAAAESAETGRRSAQRWTARPARDAREPANVIPLRPSRPRWFTSVPLAAAAGLVLAAGIGGFLLNSMIGVGTPGPSAPVSPVADAQPAATGAAMPVNAVADDPAAEAPIVTQFVLDAPAAAEVSLVGAFNSWDATATPLLRDPSTGLWTVSLPLAPGRHVYAFMVDGRTLTLDPRAPSAADPELGTSGSVILVGTP